MSRKKFLDRINKEVTELKKEQAVYNMYVDTLIELFKQSYEFTPPIIEIVQDGKRATTIKT